MLQLQLHSQCSFCMKNRFDYIFTVISLLHCPMPGAICVFHNCRYASHSLSSLGVLFFVLVAWFTVHLAYGMLCPPFRFTMLRYMIHITYIVIQYSVWSYHIRSTQYAARTWLCQLLNWLSFIYNFINWIVCVATVHFLHSMQFLNININKKKCTNWLTGWPIDCLFVMYALKSNANESYFKQKTGKNKSLNGLQSTDDMDR